MASLVGSRPRLATILSLLVLGIFLCLAQASSPPASSPSADLICHTSNPDECYPRIFQASDEFQTVHDDQELPNGLHVRMNIWTGAKEAKLNVPDEEVAALEGLPADRSVVVVDPEPAQAAQIPKGAPEYDPVGKIKEPPADEAVTFHEAFAMLKSGDDDAALDAALERMEELSHDIYYGLQITEDVEVVTALLCLMGRHDARGGGGVPRDQQAGAILAGALSNNPSALRAVTRAWDGMMNTTCAARSRPLRESFFLSLVPDSRDGTAPGRVKAKVAALNGLVKDASIRADFLGRDGMRALLQIIALDGDEWAAAQRKVGQLVLDTFLDEDMGATLGQWPRTPRLGDEECRLESMDEGCWDYHVERVMRGSKGDHWSRDLARKLAEARKSRRDEL